MSEPFDYTFQQYLETDLDFVQQLSWDLDTAIVADPQIDWAFHTNTIAKPFASNASANDLNLFLTQEQLPADDANDRLNFDESALAARYATAVREAGRVDEVSLTDLANEIARPNIRPCAPEADTSAPFVAQGTHVDREMAPRASGLKSHRCREAGCSKRYARKGDLRRHEREGHRESQLKCPVLGCHRAFKRMHRLVEHLRKPCGGSNADWHPKVAGPTQAEIVIHDYNRTATRGEVVFDVTGSVQVHENDANVDVTIECGNGMKLMAKHLKYFVHFTCPYGVCPMFGKAQTFFRVDGLAFHLDGHAYAPSHDSPWNVASKIERKAVATAVANDIEEQV